MTFFKKKSAVYKAMWKNTLSVGQVTDDNMAHVHCMLDNYGYNHTLRIRNTYCFSPATMATQTRLTVTLYVH